MNKIKTFAAMLISSIIVWGSANAADWPSKNDKITIVVPFKSGGSTDRLGRSIAQYLPISASTRFERNDNCNFIVL